MTTELPLLLDTCAAIWISEDQPLATEALNALERSHRGGEFIYLSPITKDNREQRSHKRQAVKAVDLPPTRPAPSIKPAASERGDTNIQLSVSLSKSRADLAEPCTFWLTLKLRILNMRLTTT